VPVSPDPLALVALQSEEEAQPLRVRLPDLPLALDALVLSALAKDPEARPTASALGRRLAAIVSDPFTQLEDELS